MVLSVGAQDNLASRAVKQRRAHDPLELRDALGDERGHEIELLRRSTEAPRFRDGNEGAHRGDRIHSSRFKKTEPSTSSFFRRTGAPRFRAMTIVQSVRRPVTIAGFPLSAWAFALRIWAAMMVG